MLDALIIVLVIVAIIGIGLLAAVFFELVKTLKILNIFFERTENKILPAIEELQGTLKNVKEITGEVNGMTKDLRQVTTAVGQMGSEIEQLAHLIGSTVVKAKANIGGFKAGFSTAFGILKTNVFKKGGNNEY